MERVDIPTLEQPPSSESYFNKISRAVKLIERLKRHPSSGLMDQIVWLAGGRKNTSPVGPLTPLLGVVSKILPKSPDLPLTEVDVSRKNFYSLHAWGEIEGRFKEKGHTKENSFDIALRRIDEALFSPHAGTMNLEVGWRKVDVNIHNYAPPAHHLVPSLID